MATITITPGNSFTPTETVTSTKLNDLGSPTAALTAASIGTADIADDAITTALIADDAITPALIADDAVTTPAILDANVTKAKIENLTDYTVLGNVSGGAAAPAEVTILDEDDLVTDSATALATQQSIKAYVDTNSGLKVSTATGALIYSGVNYVDLDLSSVVGSNKAMVIMEVFGGSTSRVASFKTKGSSFVGPSSVSGAASVGVLSAGGVSVGGTVVVTTDSSGKLEYLLSGSTTGVTYVVQAFQVIS